MNAAEPVNKLVVSRREDLTSDVVLIELSDPDGADLPEWEPGAHIDLVLTDEMTRQYSLCSDPADRKVWHVAVLREPEGRGGSIYIHDDLPEGTTLEVRGPRNNFPLVESDSYIFVAGGIGVTPMIPMIAAAQSAGKNWELLYGGRSRESMTYLEHLEQYESGVTIHPQDVHGLLDLQGLLGEVRPDTVIYCCGPEPLLQAIEAASVDWPTGALHIERFSPKEFDEPAMSGSFEVECTLSGVTLTIPEDKSIVDVMEANGIPVVVSCMEGTCGSCETEVIEGIPEHRDSLLSPAEQEANDTMMVCVSRSLTPRLVLEI